MKVDRELEIPYLQLQEKIMETITVEIINKKAFSLLKELENLQLIRITRHEDLPRPAERLSEKFTGKLSPSTGEQLDEHVKNIRGEWERTT
jgi:hypothetical protein